MKRKCFNVTTGYWKNVFFIKMQKCANYILKKALYDTAQKMKFSIRDFLTVNMTKSTVSCVFGHI